MLVSALLLMSFGAHTETTIDLKECEKSFLKKGVSLTPVHLFNKVTDKFVESESADFNINKLSSLVYRTKRVLQELGIKDSKELVEIESEISSLSLGGARIFVAGAGQNEKIDLVKRVIGDSTARLADHEPFSFRFFENLGSETGFTYQKDTLYSLYPVKKGHIVTKKSEIDGYVSKSDLMSLDLGQSPNELIHETFTTDFKDVHFVTSPSSKYFKKNAIEYTGYAKSSDYIFVNLTTDTKQNELELKYLKNVLKRQKDKKIAFFVSNSLGTVENDHELLESSLNLLGEIVHENNTLGAWSIIDGQFVSRDLIFSNQSVLNSAEISEVISQIETGIGENELGRASKLVEKTLAYLTSLTKKSATRKHTLNLVQKLISLNVDKNAEDSAREVLDGPVTDNLSKEWSRQLTESPFGIPESVKKEIERLLNTKLGKAAVGAFDLASGTVNGIFSLNNLFKRKKEVSVIDPSERFEKKINAETEIRWERYFKMLGAVDAMMVKKEFTSTVSLIQKDLARAKIKLNEQEIESLVESELNNQYKEWIKESLGGEYSTVGDGLIPGIAALNGEVEVLIRDEPPGIFETKKKEKGFERDLKSEILDSVTSRILYSKITRGCRDIMIPLAMASFVGTIYMIATSEESINWVNIAKDPKNEGNSSENESASVEELKKLLPYLNGFISSALAISTYLTIKGFHDLITPAKVSCAARKVYKNSLKDIQEKEVSNKMISALESKKSFTDTHLKANVVLANLYFKEVREAEVLETNSQKMPSYNEILKMTNVVMSRVKNSTAPVSAHELERIISDVHAEHKGI